MEQKQKTESKKEQKTEIKQQYTAEEFAKAAENLFHTRPECVTAAFTFANVKSATEEQAKKIVKSFLERKV